MMSEELRVKIELIKQMRPRVAVPPKLQDLALHRPYSTVTVETETIDVADVIAGLEQVIRELEIYNEADRQAMARLFEIKKDA